MKPHELSDALGKMLQRLRTEQGASQDALARAARRVGVPWTASSVAQLETGRRALTVDEAARLPLVLHRLGVPAATLSRDSARPPLEIRADAAMILATLCGYEVKQAPRMVTLEDPEKRRQWDAEWARLRIVLGPAPGGEPAGTPAAITENFAQLRRDQAGVLEQRAARRFKVGALQVAVAARQRWRRGLTEERDRRSAEATAGKSGRTAQTIRGHVTRQLLAELEPDLRRLQRTLTPRRKR
jgi:transcriptional regulator with XRE-family HTH domain